MSWRGRSFTFKHIPSETQVAMKVFQVQNPTQRNPKPPVTLGSLVHENPSQPQNITTQKRVLFLLLFSQTFAMTLKASRKHGVQQTEQIPPRDSVDKFSERLHSK